MSKSEPNTLTAGFRARRWESRGKEARLTNLFILSSVTTDTGARPLYGLAGSVLRTQHTGFMMSAEILQEEEEDREDPTSREGAGPHRAFPALRLRPEAEALQERL